MQGDSRWAYDGNPGFGEFQPAPSVDHMFQQWWFYRVAGATQESQLPFPAPSEAYVGNVVTLGFTEPLFSATASVTLTDGVSAGAATTVHEMTITNTSAAPLSMQFFCYVDLDVIDDDDDVATLIGGDPTHMRVTDGTGAYSEFRGVGASAYQSGPYPSIIIELTDAGLTNLNNSGIPSAATDVTSAYQWDLSLAPGASQTLTVLITCNEVANVVAPPQGQLVRGDCNDDGARNLVDVIFYLGYLFPNGAPNALHCDDGCDANDDGSLNLVDAIAQLNSLFGTPPVPLPGPSMCGLDTTMDNLGCTGFVTCP
ncbi:MAG: hypothetical protein AB7O52_19670 [Planctomycetota bacterium]